MQERNVGVGPVPRSLGAASSSHVPPRSPAFQRLCSEELLCLQRSLFLTRLCPLSSLQLLRKRHIGNDIVTIVFQEPGALPFTPKSIRSHFQHVFVIVRVHKPCTESVCYR